jgi:hypothetical protein
LTLSVRMQDAASSRPPVSTQPNQELRDPQMFLLADHAFDGDDFLHAVATPGSPTVLASDG